MMQDVAAASGWKQFAAFCALALTLLALVPILAATIGSGSLDFDAMAARASAETGIAWTSNLINVLRLAFAEPNLWLLILGSAVPTLAAFVMLVAARDAGQWRAFLRRYLPRGGTALPIAQTIILYAALIASLVACLVLAFVLRDWWTPGQYAHAAGMMGVGIVPAVLSAAFLDQGAVLEEGGWRGYAVPLLQKSGVTPLVAAIAVGLVWALWHVPRDIVIGLPQNLGIAEYLLFYLPSFALGTVTISVIAVFFMNRLGGSIIPAIMVHGLANDSMGLSGAATITQALTPYHQITNALPFALLAAIIFAIGGPKLGLRISSSGEHSS